MRIGFSRPRNLFFRATGIAILLYEASLWPQPQEEVVLAAIGMLMTPDFLKKDGK